MKTRGYRVELVRLSVCPSVCLSVCPSVCLSVPLDIGYFVHASLVWRSWARAFKFYTRINQGLKSCLVKVSSRSVENCWFWNTLKIVGFNIFTPWPSIQISVCISFHSHDLWSFPNIYWFVLFITMCKSIISHMPTASKPKLFVNF